MSVCVCVHAEELFIGWLPEKRWSWIVVAGQNVAYDQFPCQYQLYYRGRARNSLWYDPVFQVTNSLPCVLRMDRFMTGHQILLTSFLRCFLRDFKFCLSSQSDLKARLWI